MDRAEKRILLRPGDVVAILLVVALAAGLLWAFFAAGGGEMAEIAVDGTVVKQLPLSENAVSAVEAGDYHLTVHIENGKAYVTDADCPDKVCEHTGSISAKGASIVCAVARVSVRITGGGESDVDHTAG